MAEITKSLSGFLYNGPDLELASAPFANSIGIMYGFTPAGTGYVSFRPGNTFNSLTTLTQNGSYILSAATTGFELPGATVAVAPGGAAGPGALGVDFLTTFNSDARGTGLQFAAVNDPNLPSDSQILVTVAGSTSSGNPVDTVYLTIGAGMGQEVGVSGNGIALGGTLTLRLCNSLGNVYEQTIVLPANPDAQ